MSRARDKRRAEYIRRFVRAYAAHRRQPTADSWFELGNLLADVYAEADACGEQAVVQADARLRVDRFTPLYCWEQTVKLVPDHAAAWLRMGRNLLAFEALAKAKRCFAKAVAADPSLVEAWVGLGFITLPPARHDLSDRQLRARVERAEGFLTRAIAEDADAAAGHDVFLYLAECALRFDNYALALHWCSKSAARHQSFYKRLMGRLKKEQRRAQKG